MRRPRGCRTEEDETLITEADLLRRRCAELRRLADAIERTPLLSLDRYAGPDIWRSPVADDVRAELASDQMQLHRAADDLRWSAYRLAHEADELDAASRLGAV